MTQRHTTHFQVRSLDIDAWGDVPPATLATYMEQTALDASAALGFGPDWYEAQGTAWVIHRLRLALLAPIGYREHVDVTTWVSEMRRVRAERNYDIRDAAGRPLAAGRADWAYVSRARLAPTPVDPAIVAIFPPGDPLPLPEPPAPDPLPALARQFTVTRRAYRYEADSVGHINNTVYFNWLDEALAGALAGAGLPLTPPGGPGLRQVGVWYLVDYVRSALPGDELRINSWLTGTAEGGQVLIWFQEVERTNGELLVRCGSRHRLHGLDAAAFSPADVLHALTNS